MKDVRDKLKFDIGLRIKELRENKFGKKYGSQRRCAESLNVSPGYWGSLEHGRKLIGLEKAIELAEFFDSDPEWILYGKESELPTEGLTEAQRLIIDDARADIKESAATIDALNKKIEEMNHRISIAVRDLQRAHRDPKYADRAVKAMAEEVDRRNASGQSGAVS
jgi:transcriptional regulator with XRE-family HTH domain